MIPPYRPKGGVEVKNELLSPLVIEVADEDERLALTGLPLGSKIKQADNGFWYELRVVGGEDDTANWQVEPKTYKAILIQTGTNAPVATVLYNTLGNIVWSRQSTGLFFGTLANAFPSGKVFFYSTQGLTDDSAGSGFKFNVFRNNADKIGIFNLVDDLGWSLADEINESLGGLSLQIEVYP